MKRITINEKYTKTYASIQNLDAALEKLNLLESRHVMVYTESGRVTAIFIGAENIDVIHRGFMVVG